MAKNSSITPRGALYDILIIMVLAVCVWSFMVAAGDQAPTSSPLEAWGDLHYEQFTD